MMSPQQVKEVNAIIEKIESALKPKHEIGSQNKLILNRLLAQHKIKDEPLFFKCRREQADAIITYFVHEKKVKKHRFHTNGQEYIFLLK